MILMEKLFLNGDWELSQEEKDYVIEATVPGCVHTDLMNNDMLDDPYYRDNELQTMWIGETNWDYYRVFEVPEDLLNKDKVLLRCEGLDTLATIYINDEKIAYTDNMFRTYEFDVKSLLTAGENMIKVHFDAPLPYVRKKEEKFQLPAWVGDHRLNGGGYIRKEPCNFGWDWGPKLTTSGIWRDIYLAAFDKARLNDVWIKQDHSQNDVVGLEVIPEIECTGDLSGTENIDLKYTVSLKNKVVAEGQQNIDKFISDKDNSDKDNSEKNGINIEIEDPQLWWPNNMGKQPLYQVRVELIDNTSDNTEENDEIIGEITKRIGLRTLRLEREPDQWGESFRFVVNGKAFFAKGANWIPADTFATRLEREDYYNLLEDVIEVNMNMLRVWGGGIYEDDAFYEICDELGICVWQDFIFACATYPGFDDDFLENVKAEAVDNVKRLRHHPSIALWCGNNELEQGLVGEEWSQEEVTMSWEDYSRIFDHLLPDVVHELDPGRDYWPCSPHSPLGNREDFMNPKWGDAHLWGVWHGKEPFEWYRTCEHRFNSEFGFQSFPEPKTVYGYTEPEDRNITTHVMEHHQRSGIGNTTIMQYMLDWFRLPTSFEDVLWSSQILQGMAIKYAVEHWRRSMPRGMGTLYWQLNDCWPVASWSSIDYHGRWKALHYMARKFYAPLLVSGLEDPEKGTVEIHVTSDKLEDGSGEVSWLLTDTAGAKIDSGSKEVKIPERENICAETVKLEEHLDNYGKRELMLWLELKVGEEIVSRNFVSFARPKHLKLKDPEISVEILSQIEEGIHVQLTAANPALWTWLQVKDASVRFTDNFFHLVPGKPQRVVILPEEEITADEVVEMLQVKSLVDTYKE